MLCLAVLLLARLHIVQRGQTSNGHWRLASSVIVCSTAHIHTYIFCIAHINSIVTMRLSNVTHHGAAHDGGPVVLRPVRATPCYTYKLSLQWQTVVLVLVSAVNIVCSCFPVARHCSFKRASPLWLCCVCCCYRWSGTSLETRTSGSRNCELRFFHFIFTCCISSKFTIYWKLC